MNHKVPLNQFMITIYMPDIIWGWYVINPSDSFTLPFCYSLWIHPMNTSMNSMLWPTNGFVQQVTCDHDMTP